MKKLLGISLAVLLGIGMVGCDESTQEDITIEDTQTEQEEQIEEVEETPVEEEVENKVLTFEDEKFKYHMTTNLKDEEYTKYFDSISGRGVEFDATVLNCDFRDGYDTRFELLLVQGDLDETGNFTGPYIKVKDIGATELEGIQIAGQCKVKVKGHIDGYNPDYGWLEFDIDFDGIERR